MFTCVYSHLLAQMREVRIPKNTNAHPLSEANLLSVKELGIFLAKNSVIPSLNSALLTIVSRFYQKTEVYAMLFWLRLYWKPACANYFYAMCPFPQTSEPFKDSWT